MARSKPNVRRNDVLSNSVFDALRVLNSTYRHYTGEWMPVGTLTNIVEEASRYTGGVVFNGDVYAIYRVLFPNHDIILDYELEAREAIKTNK